MIEAEEFTQTLAETNSIPRARVDEMLEIVGLTSVSRRPGSSSSAAFSS